MVKVNLPGFETDVKWVKWTWVSGQYSQDNRHPAWCPLWLVHDFDLVQVDRDTPGPVKHRPLVDDSPTLKPMNLPAEYLGYNQQVWLDVHVLPTTPVGEHLGTVTITSDETPPVVVPLKFYVWPFELVKPRIEYAVCYRATIQIAEPDATCSDVLKTLSQAKADFKDMVRHGCTNAVSYEPCGKGMALAFGARRAAGMSNERYITCGGYQGMGPYKEYDAQWGVKENYVYGPNENSKDADWAALTAPWRESQKQGAKVWGWINSVGWLDRVGASVDMAVTNWPPSVDVAAVVKAAHKRGILMYAYGQPQTGGLHPVDYRRNDGVRLWAFGFDGVIPYAYQHTFPDGGDAWDDFAVTTQVPRDIYRSHNFTYPALHGPVATLSWEGYAAATVDTRYLTTLEQYASHPQVAAFLAQCKAEADTIDLDAMRQRAAQLIVECEG
jgi:hypothetical protein